MTTFAAVTTCNRDGWKLYGRKMVDTFDRFWSPEVPLTVYAEGFEGDRNNRVRFIDLDGAVPWLKAWKAKCPARFRANDFHHDAYRFVHKVAALGAAADLTEVDVLIWLDADVVTFAPVTVAWLEGLFPAEADVALLTREPHYPETGCMMFRGEEGRGIIAVVRALYETGVVFRLEQQHDAYVFGKVVRDAVKARMIRLHSLSGPRSRPGHPWLGGRLAERMDHCKGNRKLIGRTPKHERQLRDDVAYWR